MTSTYRYLAYDLRTNTALEELPLENVSFTYRLNGAGGFQATLPLGQRTTVGTNISELYIAATIPTKTAIYVERDGVLVWGGILWGRMRQRSARGLTLAGEDWFSYFNRRLLRQRRAYTNQEQFDIAQDLIDWAQAQAGGDILVDVDRAPADSGVQRDRVYESWERKNIGEALTQLAAVENGFDFAATSYYSSGVPTRHLELSYPRRGRTAQNTALVFETGKNIQDYDWPEDGSRTANAVDAVGSGDGAGMLITTAYNTFALDNGYPLLDDAVSFKDVLIVATLAAHARQEITNRSLPVTTPKLTVRADIEPEFGSWIVGDDVRVRIFDDDLFSDGIDTVRRIVEATVQPNSGSGDTAVLTFAESPTTVT